MILELFGSPDPLQLNGIGGGKSHTSKLVAVAGDEKYDIRYTFAQVGVEQAEVDWSKNSGNVASAVGPAAIQFGLLETEPSVTEITIRNTNTGTIIDQRVPVTDDAPAILGEYSIDGVPGTGAKIETTYLDPGGSVTGHLLPASSSTTTLDVDGELQVSIVDIGSLIIFVRAADLGLEGTELPGELESRSQVLDRLEGVRSVIRERLNLTDAKRSNPALGIVSPPQSYACTVDRTVASEDIDVTARFISLQPHHAISMTGAMCLGAATRIPGTIPADVAERDSAEITIGHPKGTVTVNVDIDTGENEPVVRSATYFRTACPLAKAEIYYRKIGQLA